MNHRPISAGEAGKVLQILMRDCKFRCARERDQTSFIVSIMDCADPCHEYRFQGALGFGGKFRNNGNRDDIPYVDCYSEDLTPERGAMIEAANEKLSALFSPNCDGENDG